MAEQGPTTDLLGNTDWGEGGNPFADSPEPEVETPAEPVATETPEAETVVDVEAPAEVTVTAEPETTETETPEGEEKPAEVEQLLAGKYKTTEDLVAAYENVNREASRMAQERALQARQIEDQKAFIEKAKPIIEQLHQQEQARQAVPPEGMEYGDPEAMQAWAAQQRAQMQEQMQTQFTEQQTAWQQQQQAQQWQNELNQFRSSHPDAAPMQPLEQDMARIFTEYGEDLPKSGEGLDVAYTLAKNPQAKQIIDRFRLVPGRDEVQRAVELQTDPNLLRYVAANPSTIEADDDGWEYVKTLASIPQALNATTQGAQSAQQQQAEAEKQRAFVETGSGGQPAQAAPGERPGEESFQKVIDFWREQNQVLGPAPTK